jgi:hypothetical protein
LQPSEKQTLTTLKKDCVQTSVQTKPQNSPKSADSLPDDLEEIVTVWPKLPEHIKQAINALIQTSLKEEE